MQLSLTLKWSEVKSGHRNLHAGYVEVTEALADTLQEWILEGPDKIAAGS